MRRQSVIPTEPSTQSPRAIHANVPDLISTWKDAVIVYMDAALTYESDTFPAIAGIAKAFENHGLGTYHAGLWTTALPGLLCWKSATGRLPPTTRSLSDLNPNRIKSKRPQSFVAPTWSWASVIGGVTFLPAGGANAPKASHAVARITDISCTPVDSDAYCRISAGHIELETVVVRVPAEKLMSRGGRPFYERFGFECTRFYMDSGDDLPKLRRSRDFACALLTISDDDGTGEGVALSKNSYMTYSRFGIFNVKMANRGLIAAESFGEKSVITIV